MKIEILVEGEGLADIEVVQVPKGSGARAVIEAVAAKSGFPAEEALLFVEDGEDPLDPTLAEDDVATTGRILHVHRAPHVDVTVHYKELSIDRRFRPSARVQSVLDWAVGSEGFKIDPQIAPEMAEMELALHGTTTPLPKSAHIGRYVRHPKPHLVLDLIRGIIPNGSR